MHYIRFLRPPKQAMQRNGNAAFEIIFTVTTDLGDTFLYLEQPLELNISIEVRTTFRNSLMVPGCAGKVIWQPGMRVAKPVIKAPAAVLKGLGSGPQLSIRVSAEPSLSAGSAKSILDASPENTPIPVSDGQIMPASVAVPDASDDVDVLTRRLYLGSAGGGNAEFVEVEEEIGESIARHIWDAGVVSLSSIAGLYTSPDLSSSTGPCMQYLKSIIGSKERLGVLELGCGVGILGIGFASLCSRARGAPMPNSRCTVLMTDLEEAETRARSNLERMRRNNDVRGFTDVDVNVVYENLDWEDGRQGVFGREARSRVWDLILISDCTYNVDMLPALVETLSALHASNMSKTRAGNHEDEPFTTKVFLATKPRHPSERALFDLMAAQGWRKAAEQVLTIPVLGSEDAQRVEMYLFEKG